MARPVPKRYFEQLFEEIPEGIVLADRMGRVLRANDEFCRMFGYLPQEVLGRMVDDLIASDAQRASALEITKGVAQGRKFTLEMVRQRKDGSPVHVSLLALPIVGGRREVMVFGIYRDISARKAAEQALERSRDQLEEAYAQLEFISNLDGLTGIPNRRYFENFFAMEWRRWCREGRPLAVIMIDIDYFKRFNDLYGHLAGDRCLKQVAQALQVVNRPGDLVARYGGEEFVVVLSGTGMADAWQIAEQMRHRVWGQRIPHDRSKIDQFVTISLGVAAQVPLAESDPMALILEADQALYQAKGRGRNQVVSSDQEAGLQDERPQQ